MQIKTLYNLHVASGELKAMAKHGHDAKELEAKLGHSVCRLGDSAIAQYEETAKAIDSLLARFPGCVENYIEEQNKAISEALGLPYMTNEELAS